MISILQTNNENSTNCHHLGENQFLNKRFENKAISTLIKE